MKSNGVSWGALALEVFSITLAVVAGFAISEWQEDRRNLARADAAIASIANELTENRAELARVAPYYARLAATLDSIAAVRGPGPLDAATIPEWQGLSPPVLRRSSYTVSTSTGTLEYVPFSTASAIAEAYEAQGRVSEAVDQAIAAMIRGELDQLDDWLRLISLMAELAGSATQTLGSVLTTIGVDGPR